MNVRRIGLGVVLLGTVAACGGADRDDPPARRRMDPALGEAAEQATEAPAACAEGDRRRCEIFIGEHNNVVTCFVGVRVCQDGAWGPCVDPETLDETIEEPSDPDFDQDIQ
jgi:hypothetical protein